MLRSLEYFETNFTKGQLIGKGSFSRVFEVVSRVDYKKYALKEIEIDGGEDLKDDNLRQKAQNSWEFIAGKFPEIISALIDIHPCIAEIFFFFVRRVEDIDVLCIVMEFFPVSLEQEFHKFRQQDKRYAPRHYLKILQCLVSGLSYLQTKYQVAHRDLKPANVMVTIENNYKLIDFGISTTFLEGDSSKLRTLVGTPKYMAPELLESFLTEKSRTNYNPYKSDCFSLGVMMLELCCDSSEEISGINRVFEMGETKLEMLLIKAENLYGVWVKDILSKMLERDPEKRPSYKQIQLQINSIREEYKKIEKGNSGGSLITPSLNNNECRESLNASFVAASLEHLEKKESVPTNNFQLALLLGGLYLILIAQVSNYRSYLQAYSYSQNESMTYLHESLNFIRATVRTIVTFLMPVCLVVLLKKVGSIQTLLFILISNALINFLSLFIKEFNTLVCFRILSDRFVITSPMAFFILAIEKSGTKMALIFSCVFCAENLHNLFKYIPQVYVDLYSKNTINDAYWKFSLVGIVLNLIAIGLLLPLWRLKSSKVSFYKANAFLSVYEEYLNTYLYSLFDMFRSSVFWLFVFFFSVITTDAYSVELLLFDENIYSVDRLLINILYQLITIAISVITVILFSEVRKPSWILLSSCLAFSSSLACNLSRSFYPIIITAIPRGICCALLPRMLVDRLVSRNIIYGALFSVYLVTNILRTIIEMGNFESFGNEYNRYLFVALGYAFALSGLILNFIIWKKKLNFC